MNKYNLGFISDEDIYNHVKTTVLQYRKNIDLKEFNKNIIDPIKMTFDANIYGEMSKDYISSINVFSTMLMKIGRHQTMDLMW